MLAIFVAGLCCGVSHATSKPTASKPSSKSVHGKSSKHRRRSRKGAWKKHGQQKIDASRATQIQQALIREKYLTGEPTGSWDARTQAALVKYQADNGWQSKVVPDSRALIKLGLGPNYSSELLNAPPKTSSAGTPSTTASRSVEGTAGKQ